MQQLSSLPVLLAFQMNRAEISNRFCENRNAPEKHCCGKCYLQKQLKENENKQKPLGTLLRDANLLLFLESFEATTHNNTYLFLSSLHQSITLPSSRLALQQPSPPPEA
jgi:hypothetical protein